MAGVGKVMLAEPDVARGYVSEHGRLIGASLLGLGAALYLWRWWNEPGRARPGSGAQWHEVGVLGDIVCYPVKSLGPVRLDAASCTPLGIKRDSMRDRFLVVVNQLDRECVTARQYPRMLLISPSIRGKMLTLKVKGMEDISVELPEKPQSEIDFTQLKIWDDKVVGVDCGDEVAQWLSRFLLREEVGLRLVHYPLDRPVRKVRGGPSPFPFIRQSDAGAYADETSYTLENEASIIEFNCQAEDPVKPLQLRPNLVVKGCKPFDEDTWDFIKIGECIFRNIRPCACDVLSTLDPYTAQRNRRNEPLTTLRKFRLFADPAIRSFVRGSPTMNIHVGLRSREDCTIRVGDPVSVIKTKNALKFMSS